MAMRGANAWFAGNRGGVASQDQMMAAVIDRIARKQEADNSRRARGASFNRRQSSGRASSAKNKKAEAAAKKKADQAAALAIAKMNQAAFEARERQKLNEAALGEDKRQFNARTALSQEGMANDVRSGDLAREMERRKMEEAAFQFDETQGLRRDQMSDAASQFYTGKMADMQTSDLARGESARQYDAGLGQRGREFDQQLGFNREELGERSRQFDSTAEYRDRALGQTAALAGNAEKAAMDRLYAGANISRDSMAQQNDYAVTGDQRRNQLGNESFLKQMQMRRMMEIQGQDQDAARSQQWSKQMEGLQGQFNEWEMGVKQANEQGMSFRPNDKKKIENAYGQLQVVDAAEARGDMSPPQAALQRERQWNLLMSLKPDWREPSFDEAFTSNTKTDENGTTWTRIKGQNGEYEYKPNYAPADTRASKDAREGIANLGKMAESEIKSLKEERDSLLPFMRDRISGQIDPEVQSRVNVLRERLDQLHRPPEPGMRESPPSEPPMPMQGVGAPMSPPSTLGLQRHPEGQPQPPQMGGQEPNYRLGPSSLPDRIPPEMSPLGQSSVPDNLRSFLSDMSTAKPQIEKDVTLPASTYEGVLSTSDNGVNKYLQLFGTNAESIPDKVMTVDDYLKAPANEGHTRKMAVQQTQAFNLAVKIHKQGEVKKLTGPADIAVFRAMPSGTVFEDQNGTLKVKQ